MRKKKKTKKRRKKKRTRSERETMNNNNNNNKTRWNEKWWPWYVFPHYHIWCSTPKHFPHQRPVEPFHDASDAPEAWIDCSLILSRAPVVTSRRRAPLFRCDCGCLPSCNFSLYNIYFKIVYSQIEVVCDFH